jgi:hypothetical protein
VGPPGPTLFVDETGLFKDGTEGYEGKLLVLEGLLPMWAELNNLD